MELLRDGTLTMPTKIRGSYHVIRIREDGIARIGAMCQDQIDIRLDYGAIYVEGSGLGLRLYEHDGRAYLEAKGRWNVVAFYREGIMRIGGMPRDLGYPLDRAEIQLEE